MTNRKEIYVVALPGVAVRIDWCQEDGAIEATRVYQRPGSPMSDNITERLEKMLKWALGESDAAAHEFNCSAEDDARTALDQDDAKATVRDALAAIEALGAERDLLREFAREVLDGYRTGVVGDIDGGWLEEKALALGLLVASGSEYEDAPYRLSAALTSEGTETR